MKNSLKLSTVTPFYLALCWVYIFLAATSASAQTKDDVVKAWQQHIASLNSLQLDYEQVITGATYLDTPIKGEPLTWKYMFAMAGDKYISRVELPKFKGERQEILSVASAYNGEYYQTFTDSKAEARLYRYTKEKDDEFPYFGNNPLTVQYQFAFAPKDSIVIKTLKNPVTWERTLERVTEFFPSTRKGHQGFIVKLTVPQSKKIYEVFVDAKTLLPNEWTVVVPVGPGEVLEEMEVKAFTSIGKEGSAFLFPSEIVVTHISNEEPLEVVHQKAILKSLKVNDPIPESVFTIIAPQNAILVDEDVQERLFQEKQKAAASRDAANLPRAEDNPANQIGIAQSTVKAGEKAPSFSIADSNGKNWSLDELRGRKGVLLTFFPKCFTGGCANHLSSLRDVYPRLQDFNIEVIAVSVDPAEGEKGQKEFAKQWKLPFSLIPDTERKLSMLYGAVQNKEQLAARMTVLIDKQGIVRYVDTGVDVQTHGKDMLDKILVLGLNK